MPAPERPRAREEAQRKEAAVARALEVLVATIEAAEG
jgi:hypothetical protein